jgi:hypothetical protein
VSAAALLLSASFVAACARGLNPALASQPPSPARSPARPPARPPARLPFQCLTTDHKPDMAEERRRIEKSGGSLAYLHGGKPFIRGGDFAERQLKGDRPMQLNYSRAFGGKVRAHACARARATEERASASC